jgi:hypothetical protein
VELKSGVVMCWYNVKQWEEYVSSDV